MSRQIKIRIWDTMEKKFEWINLTPNTIGHIIFSSYPGRKILEQFSGLLDKNGKEIYEGDILKYSSSNPKFTKVIVRWTREEEDNHPGFVVHDSYCQYGEPEVIGNIHENPELL